MYPDPHATLLAAWVVLYIAPLYTLFIAPVTARVV